MAKNLSALFFILLFFFNLKAQDLKLNFEELMKNKDTIGVEKLLKKWETAKPNDPELFISYFNYNFLKSKEASLALSTKSSGSNELVLKDSLNHTAYIGTNTVYNPEYIAKGIAYIDKGILLYPDRLDMRFGKIYILGLIGNYNEFTKKIKETIDYGFKINHYWLWDNGKPLEDSKSFFLTSIQGYEMTIYNTQNDDLLPLMRDISLTVLKYEPNHVESLSNVAITYLVKNNYTEALKYLLQAEKASPKDIVVLNNIAEVYSRSSEKIKAKAYLEKIIKYGNADEVDMAKDKIQKL